MEIVRKTPLNKQQGEVSVAELKRHHLFNSLNDEQWNELVEGLTIAELSQRDVLFTTADPIKEIYVLQSGCIKLNRVSSEGNEKIVELLSPGESFAEAALFSDNSRYPVNATAITHSKVWCIDSASYKHLLMNSPQACFAVMAEMSRRLHQLVDQIDLLTLENATTRLIAYLSDQAPPEHVDAYEIKLDYSKLALASRLSIKPETLSRILGRLKELNLIETSESTISLTNVSELRRKIHTLR